MIREFTIYRPTDRRVGAVFPAIDPNRSVPPPSNRDGSD